MEVFFSKEAGVVDHEPQVIVSSNNNLSSGRKISILKYPQIKVTWMATEMETQLEKSMLENRAFQESTDQSE